MEHKEQLSGDGNSTLPGDAGKYLTALQYITFISVILYFGRDIFIPLSFAALISFVLYPICAWMERRGIGRMIAIVINVTILTILLLLISSILAKQIIDFLEEWPVFQTKLYGTLNAISRFMIDTLGISRDQQDRWIAKAADQAAMGALAFVRNAISFSTFSAVMAILIPVYAVLILFYRRLWVEILFRIFPGEGKDSIREILSLTIQAYYNFIKGMFIVYLIVGILNSLGLFLLGVPHALLFGFVTSVLTFIPYIGILAGSLLPITVAWATHDSIWYPLGVVGVFAFVQYLEANVIFPFAVSSRLHVNTFVVLVAIFLGGILWGVAGMILFVPFVGIIKLVADHNPRLKTLTMMLGTSRV